MEQRFKSRRVIFEKDAADVAKLTKEIAIADGKLSDMSRERELAEILGFPGCHAICIWKGNYHHGTYCDYFIRVIGPRGGNKRTFGVVEP